MRGIHYPTGQRFIKDQSSVFQREKYCMGDRMNPPAREWICAEKNARLNRPTGLPIPPLPPLPNAQGAKKDKKRYQNPNTEKPLG